MSASALSDLRLPLLPPALGREGAVREGVEVLLLVLAVAVAVGKLHARRVLEPERGLPGNLRPASRDSVTTFCSPCVGKGGNKISWTALEAQLVGLKSVGDIFWTHVRHVLWDPWDR